MSNTYEVCLLVDQSNLATVIEVIAEVAEIKKCEIVKSTSEINGAVVKHRYRDGIRNKGISLTELITQTLTDRKIGLPLERLQSACAQRGFAESSVASALYRLRVEGKIERDEKANWHLK